MQNRSRRISLIVSSIHTDSLLQRLETSSHSSDSRDEFLSLYKHLISLPVELLRMILDFSWSSYFFSPAVVLYQSRYLKYVGFEYPASVEVCSSVPIFLGMIDYSHANYVSYVSNKRHSALDIEVRLPNEIYEIKLVLDKTGIRHLFFLGRENKRTQWMNSNKTWTFRTLRKTPLKPIDRIYLNRDVCPKASHVLYAPDVATVFIFTTCHARLPYTQTSIR